MGEMMVSFCDICGGVPDGDRVDHVNFFYPCKHAVCCNCQHHEYGKKDTRIQWPQCPKCGKGRSGI